MLFRSLQRMGTEDGNLFIISKFRKQLLRRGASKSRHTDHNQHLAQSQLQFSNLMRLPWRPGAALPCHVTAIIDSRDWGTYLLTDQRWTADESSSKRSNTGMRQTEHYRKVTKGTVVVLITLATICGSIWRGDSAEAHSAGSQIDFTRDIRQIGRAHV